MMLSTKNKKEIEALYDKDFFLWITSHIDLLKKKKWDLIDIEHLIEELDSMGKSEICSLASLFGILFAHLYKWDHFPKSRSKSWINSIEYSQEEINRLLNKQPSLKSKLNEAIEDGWSYAKKILIDDTNIDYRLLPKECPYSFEEAINRKIE